MKLFKHLNLLALGILVSCATVKEEPFQVSPGKRSVAAVPTAQSEFSKERTEKTVKGVFHSYLLGQARLQEFDDMLAKNQPALESEAYMDLQAIRVLVDGFEDNLEELYIDLVEISASPNFSAKEKKDAGSVLKIIRDFYNGILPDQEEIPENLRPLVLSNLKDRTSQLIGKLKALRDDPAVTKNDNRAIAAFDEHIDLLKDSSKKSFKNWKSYRVAHDLVQKTLTRLEKDKDFQGFKSQVKSVSKKIKVFVKKVVKGRSTSSDSIYPSTSKAGNISGSSWPANTWSLTYDDGPGGKTSPTILQNLKDRKMKATFFMLAKQVEGLPTTAKNIADAGMDIASHSYDHAQLTKVGPAALEKQIGGSKKIIEEKLGKDLKLFRLPYGAGTGNTLIRSKIAEHDLVHVFWNVDTLDWQDKNPTSIYNRTLKQMAANGNKGIILFHDIHQQSVIASTMLMDYFREKKVKVCTVQAVVDQINKGLSTCEE
jgi:peptidoglycan/xylan/chitin deacetylase (PgdA/CDA1 family)